MQQRDLILLPPKKFCHKFANFKDILTFPNLQVIVHIIHKRVSSYCNVYTCRIIVHTYIAVLYTFLLKKYSGLFI